MAALGAQSIASSYEQLLHVDADGGGNSTTHVSVKDGDNGTTFALTLATDAVMITSTNRLEFGDNASYIHQSADGVLDLVSDTEIEINATTIDINGAVDISGDTTIAGDVIMANGKGISFAATSDAGGMSSEILDDYEEGSWTAAFGIGSGTVTIHSSYDTGLYTKIGRLVSITGGFAVSAFSSPTGDVTITGLPFTSVAQSSGYDSIAAGSVYFRDAASDIANYVTGFVNQATTNFIVREGGTTGSGGDLATHIDTGTIIYVNLQYFV